MQSTPPLSLCSSSVGRSGHCPSVGSHHSCSSSTWSLRWLLNNSGREAFALLTSSSGSDPLQVPKWREGCLQQGVRHFYSSVYTLESSKIKKILKKTFMASKFLQLLLANSCVSEIPGRATEITDGVNLRNEKNPNKWMLGGICWLLTPTRLYS